MSVGLLAIHEITPGCMIMHAKLQAAANSMVHSKVKRLSAGLAYTCRVMKLGQSCSNHVASVDDSSVEVQQQGEILAGFMACPSSWS